jgi:hypothetical protein
VNGGNKENIFGSHYRPIHLHNCRDSLHEDISGSLHFVTVLFAGYLNVCRMLQIVNARIIFEFSCIGTSL